MNIDIKNEAEIKTVVLYHKGCNDGLVAAWAAKQVLGNEALYIPYQYGDLLPPETQNKHLILVDLSLPVDAVQYLSECKDVRSVLIIDHHQTAAPLLEVMEPVKTYADYLWKLLAHHNEPSGKNPLMICFDLERSGAVLSYAFFNDQSDIVDKEIPYPIQLIEDYDLWKFEHMHTRAVNAWLRNMQPDFSHVDQLMAHSPGVHETIVAAGQAILDYDQNIIQSVVKSYVEKGRLDEHTFALVNGPHHLRNEIAEAILEQDNAVDFVIVYNRRRDKTIYSLRSKEYDVSKLAECFGGGGHANAAAFSIPHNAESLLLSRDAFIERLFEKLGV